MKKLIPIGLLSMSAAMLSPAMAQAPTEPEAARVDAEEAKTRKELEAARERLDKAAREVAELSAKLGAHARHEIRFIEGGPRRAVLGVQIEADPESKGARVLSVSPGGPAAEAGLRDRDIIIALDGESLTGPDPDRQLVTRMRKVKPDQKVKVVVLRDGKTRDYVVVARPMALENRVFSMAMPEMGAMGAVAGQPVMRQFRAFWPGEFEGLELATITPKLGAYFGVNEGVLVVQAPKDGAFKLEDGDVLQAIDGRKPDNGPHALRILRSYRTGEKLTLTVLRQRKPVTLAVTMPERPEMGDVFQWATPNIAPPPAAPHAPPPPPAGAVPAPGADVSPAVRVAPEGAGTIE
jgi:predicted metalloprotease with PDZ domain